MSKEFDLSDEITIWLARELGPVQAIAQSSKKENQSLILILQEFVRELIADEYINSNGEASKRINKLAGDIINASTMRRMR